MFFLTILNALDLHSLYFLLYCGVPGSVRNGAVYQLSYVLEAYCRRTGKDSWIVPQVKIPSSQELLSWLLHSSTFMFMFFSVTSWSLRLQGKRLSEGMFENIIRPVKPKSITLKCAWDWLPQKSDYCTILEFPSVFLWPLAGGLIWRIFWLPKPDVYCQPSFTNSFYLI